MKKNLFLWNRAQAGKWITAFCLSLFLVGVASCQHGIDDSERFSGGVTNATLESPDPSKVTFTKIAGTPNVKIEWPVVFGAGGYEVSLYIVDDPENPVLVGEENEYVEGCSTMREYEEDVNYMAKIRALGNVKLNNKDAIASSEVPWDTFLPASIIPNGTDLTIFFAENPVETEKGVEVGFELEPGGSYTMSGIIDFDLNLVTLRGNKTESRPTIVLGEAGGFMTQAGLQIKWINFDCTASTKPGFISLSTTPSASISTEALGYKAAGANQDGFVINDPVLIQNCNFKNLNKSLLYGSGKAWSLRNLSIMGCIVQMNNATSSSVIRLDDAEPGNGLIKNLVVKGNTFLNLVKNGSGYFIRYKSGSNAQPKKIFGNNDDSTTFTIEHNTFSHVMSNKDFANQMPTVGTFTINLQYNVFYDVFRIYQLLVNNTKKNTAGNTIFADGVKTWGGVPNGNDTGGRKDDNGNPYATLEDPLFEGPFEVELDLTKENGGLNFKPTAPIAVANKAGDPRWYE